MERSVFLTVRATTREKIHLCVERLFGCFDDLLICCCGFWCTSCLFGYNASKLDGKNGCVMCCIHYCLAQSSLCWVAQYFQRQKMRQRYGLKEDERCNDLAASFCCSSCALCQETREMKSRGRNLILLVAPPDRYRLLFLF